MTDMNRLISSMWADRRRHMADSEGMAWKHSEAASASELSIFQTRGADPHLAAVSSNAELKNRPLREAGFLIR